MTWEDDVDGSRVLLFYLKAASKQKKLALVKITHFDAIVYYPTLLKFIEL